MSILPSQNHVMLYVRALAHQFSLTTWEKRCCCASRQAENCSLIAIRFLMQVMHAESRLLLIFKEHWTNLKLFSLLLVSEDVHFYVDVWEFRIRQTWSIDDLTTRRRAVTRILVEIICKFFHSEAFVKFQEVRFAGILFKIVESLNELYGHNWSCEMVGPFKSACEMLCACGVGCLVFASIYVVWMTSRLPKPLAHDHSLQWRADAIRWQASTSILPVTFSAQKNDEFMEQISDSEKLREARSHFGAGIPSK